MQFQFNYVPYMKPSDNEIYLNVKADINFQSWDDSKNADNGRNMFDIYRLAVDYVYISGKWRDCPQWLEDAILNDMGIEHIECYQKTNMDIYWNSKFEG